MRRALPSIRSGGYSELYHCLDSSRTRASSTTSEQRPRQNSAEALSSGRRSYNHVHNASGREFYQSPPRSKGSNPWGSSSVHNNYAWRTLSSEPFGRSTVRVSPCELMSSATSLARGFESFSNSSLRSSATRMDGYH